MLFGWVTLSIAIFYLFGLFAIAYYGDKKWKWALNDRVRPIIYSLATAIYCSSWTFLGSVGVASNSLLDFLPIYIGPILAVTLGAPLFARIVRISKTQKITSIADFISARYGKNEFLGSIVTIIIIAGTIPYIALQLKAIFLSFDIIFMKAGLSIFHSESGFGWDISFFITIVITVFSIAFGTRYVDATEHQNGLMLAIATESFIKLISFIFVGLIVTFGIFYGFSDLLEKARDAPKAYISLNTYPNPWNWFTLTILSFGAMFLLPRQFHVMVVENRNRRDLKKVTWFFPIYLVLINVFVVPIALAGGIIFPENNISRDFLVLSIPLQKGFEICGIIALLGAFSAATAMIIVESIACSIMISNNIAIPFLLRNNNLSILSLDINNSSSKILHNSNNNPSSVGTVLNIRRIAIIILIFLGFSYNYLADENSLSTIGALSFAAIGQLMPCFFFGLFWERANATGAIGGLIAGILSWVYFLFLPTFAKNGIEVTSLSFSDNLPIIASIPPYAQSVFLSLGLNITIFVILSILRRPNSIENTQANIFIRYVSDNTNNIFRFRSTSVTVEDLRLTVRRYLGDERTDVAFSSFIGQRGADFSEKQEADNQTIRFSEQLLTSAIGSASARLVLSLMLRRRNVSTEAALKLLDDASAAFQHSRNLLQHALDHTRQGVTVLDRELRLMCWNRAFLDLFELPAGIVQFGIGMDEIVNYNARRGLYGRALSADIIAQRITSLVQETEPHRLQLTPSNRVIEIRSNHLPDGGVVTTYSDITEAVIAEHALEEANATLEKRVKERTDELMQVNEELEHAKAEAENANVSKTRFLAAASHDIAQPLNAAKLYATALSERLIGNEQAGLASNVETALGAVEEILSALLEISKLDAGRLHVEMSYFSVSELFEQLAIEFSPIAKSKGISIHFAPSSLAIKSDRRLLRRLLQNLISNAIKYTPAGRVLIGALRSGDNAILVVGDTGIGIPPAQHELIFKEFQRLEQGARIESGLGLGLSIVERIVKVLDISLNLTSAANRGTIFRLKVPRAPISYKMSKPVEVIQEFNSLASPLTGAEIAVIDNEPAILDGMKHLLSGWGCKVTTGSTSHDIFKKYDNAGIAPEILLVDYQLDDSNGIDSAIEIRNKYSILLPVILITADRSDDVKEMAAMKNIFMLNKPLKPPALRALLTHLMLQDKE